MTDAYNMVHIAQSELEQLICEDTSSICEAKQRMIRKHSPQSHRPRMQNSLMTQTTQTSMPMHNLNLLSQHNIPKYREETEHSWERRSSVYHQERDMVDLQAVCEVSDAGSPFVCVGYDNDFVPTVYEFCGELVDV